MLNEAEGKCELVCDRPNQVLNENENACICDPNTNLVLDAETNECKEPPKVCDFGYQLNQETNECILVCDSGYQLNQETNTCILVCDSGYQLDQETNTCILVCDPPQVLNE